MKRAKRTNERLQTNRDGGICVTPGMTVKSAASYANSESDDPRLPN
jgi:hypothetical protein